MTLKYTYEIIMDLYGIFINIFPHKSNELCWVVLYCEIGLLICVIDIRIN